MALRYATPDPSTLAPYIQSWFGTGATRVVVVQDTQGIYYAVPHWKETKRRSRKNVR